MTPEQWQLAASALKTATWTPEVTAKINAPYAAAYFFAEYVNDVVATDDLVFVAHNNSVDVFTNDPEMRWLQALPQGVDEIHADGNFVVLLNGFTGSLKGYRTDGNGGLTQAYDIVDASIINMTSSFCLANDTLFGVGYRPVGNTSQSFVGAWRITGAGLQAIDSISVPAETSSATLHCHDNTVVVASDYRLEIVRLANDTLTHTDGTAVFSGDVFFDGTRIHVITNGSITNGQRLMFTLDADAQLSLAKVANQRGYPEFELSGYVENGDSAALVVYRWEDLIFVDKATQQVVSSLPVPANRGTDLLVHKRMMWLWANQGIWAIDAGKVLSDGN
jgi:hypothetical protein